MTIANAPPLPSIRRFTVEEFDDLDNSKDYELDDGLLVERTMGAKADWVSLALGSRIFEHVGTHRLGWAFGTEGGYQCFAGHPDRVRKPDGSFIRFGRLPNEEVPDGWIRQVPDLVFESVSPNDKAEALQEKLLQYQEAGIPLIWVIYPSARRAQVVRPSGAITVLSENDSLDGENILPGFRVRLGDLFPPTPVVDPAPMDAR